MALPSTKTFSNFIVEIEQTVTTGGNTTTSWVAPCGFDSKSLTMSAASSSASVPDCENPEAPAWDVKGVDTLSGQIQGSGVMATENSEMWDQWFDSGLPLNIRLRIPTVGYRTGPAILTNLGDTTALKSNGNLVQRAVTLDSAGPWPWVSGDPTS